MVHVERHIYKEIKHRNVPFLSSVSMLEPTPFAVAALAQCYRQMGAKPRGCVACPFVSLRRRSNTSAVNQGLRVSLTAVCFAHLK